MSTIQPDDMSAIDADVARTVMGWTEGTNANYWWRQAADGGFVDAFQKSNGYHGDEARWRPSNDVACAMLVVEHLHARGLAVYIDNVPIRDQSRPGWTVYIERPDSELWRGQAAEADGASLPLAICRAALAFAGAALRPRG